MSRLTSIPEFVVFEGAHAHIMGRLRDSDGSLITQATVSSIAWSIYDHIAPTTVVASGTLTVADVVFDTLQVDARWTQENPLDSTGYNFRAVYAPTRFPRGGRTYRLEQALTLSSGEVAMYPCNVTVIDMFSK